MEQGIDHFPNYGNRIRTMTGEQLVVVPASPKTEPSVRYRALGTFQRCWFGNNGSPCALGISVLLNWKTTRSLIDADSAENESLLMEKSPVPQPAKHQKTILVVDDEARVSKFVSALLRDEGHCVLTAENGMGALDLASAHAGKIDLLLTDFCMPGISGVELAEALTLERPETKVVIMSGYCGETLMLNEGWHFVAKPFVASHLCSLVAGLMATI